MKIIEFLESFGFSIKILIPGFLCSVPVLLALSVTYILEKNLSHENIE